MAADETGTGPEWLNPFTAAMTAETEAGPEWLNLFTAAITGMARQLPFILGRLECSHPRPLCIDGHAYHRRQRARRRRKG